MPFGYSDTRLWLDTLATRENDPYAAQRSALATAYHKLRERAAVLAGEIAQDLREYTVHDATHIDALWELADAIAGQDFKLNPAEAFVLGSAFMVHDLGMGLAAWPGGLDELRAGARWKDILAGEISRLTHEPATGDQLDNPPENAVKRATETLLREQHAAHGQDLAVVGWTSLATGDQYHLIDDPDLRNRFGSLIGEIAASHGWDLADVATRFGGDVIGAPVDCPDDWTVDPLKLACLLRTADAAHLDERRAPGFLRTVRRPSGYSDLHWAFQGYLQRAHRTDDRLVFTSARPFELGDAQAWWLCFDSLRMVDRELTSVDLLLRDKSRERLAAKSVKGVESPTRLAELIRTSGWEPVNAEVTVSDVPALVRKLGGESLYGPHPRIALRELVQNARDAIRALAALLGGTPGVIEVRLERKGNGEYWLYVDDSGIGMSKQLITGPLLDFGSSYWGSDLMRTETAGLAATGFSSVGRFGIGFYSIFMLGDVVEVVSRRFDEASAQTKVLTFESGASVRPIYRAATDTEVRHSGGTSVRVKLREDPFSQGGLLDDSIDGALTLEQCAALIAPALDVDLVVRELDAQPIRAVRANDWIDMDPTELLRRISPVPQRVWGVRHLQIEETASRMRTIEKGGRVVARVAVAPTPPGAVDEDGDVRLWAYPVIGGLSTGKAIGGMAGLVAASAKTADRLHGDLVVEPEAWQEWATEQAALWAEVLNHALERRDFEADLAVNFFFRLRAETGALYVARSSQGLMNMAEVRSWMSERQEVILADSYSVDIDTDKIWHRKLHVEMELGDNVLIGLGTSGRYGDWDLLPDEHPDKEFKPERLRRWQARTVEEWYYSEQLSTEGVLLRELAATWDIPLSELLPSVNFSVDPHDVEIGCAADESALVGSVAWLAKRA